MSDEPTTRRLLNPQEIRAATIIDVDLGDGTIVRARRLDLEMSVFEGVMPTPLMNAAQKLVQTHGRPANERLDDLDETEKQEVLATLRRHAVAVVLEPIIVAVDDQNPDHLPVDLLRFPQLLAIWNATTITPKVGAATAANFRQRPLEPAAPVLHAGQDLRPAAQRVDHAPAFISG
jgi:hypothetical protein